MEFKITDKNIDIETTNRVRYLVIIILLAMYYTGWGKEKTISLLKIHLLLWVLKSESRMNTLLKSIENDCNDSIGFWNINLQTNSILTLMIEDGLCGFNGTKYYLKEVGIQLIEQIKKEKDIFQLEQDFLKKVSGNRLSEKKVDSLKSLWSV